MITDAQLALMQRLDGWKPAFMLRDDYNGVAASGDLRRLKRMGYVKCKMGGAQICNWALTESGRLLVGKI